MRHLAVYLAGPSARGVMQSLRPTAASASATPDAAAAAAAAASSGASGAAVVGAGSASASSALGGAFAQQQVRWATKKQGGSTRNKADSAAKRLGAKLLGGALAFPGQIIARQRGARYHAGANVGVGSDFTLYSRVVGWVRFARDRAPSRAGGHRPPKERRVVSVEPLSRAWWASSPGGQAAARAEMDALVAARREALARVRSGRAAAAPPAGEAAERRRAAP